MKATEQYFPVYRGAIYYAVQSDFLRMKSESVIIQMKALE